MESDINLGGREPDPFEGYGPEDHGTSAVGSTAVGEPEPHPLQPAAPGVVEGSLGGDGEALSDEAVTAVEGAPEEEIERTDAPPAPEPEPEPLPEVEEPPAEAPEAPQEPEEPAEAPEAPEEPDEPEDAPQESADARKRGGSPSRQYLIFEEVDLGDLVERVVATELAPGLVGPVVDKLKQSGAIVYSRRSFDQGGRTFDSVEARNGQNALRAAGRLIGQGYEGRLVPVPENSWTPRVVSTRPREGMAVDVS